MKETKRQRQVATLIQREFSTILQNEGAFLYGAGVMATVTNVRMSSDMGIAYIYVSVYNAPYKQEVIKQLWENLSHLRGELGKRIRRQVRRIPMLKFYIDDTLDEMEHIDSIFQQLHADKNVVRSMKDALKDKEDKEKEGDKSTEE